MLLPHDDDGQQQVLGNGESEGILEQQVDHILAQGDGILGQGEVTQGEGLEDPRAIYEHIIQGEGSVSGGEGGKTSSSRFREYRARLTEEEREAQRIKDRERKAYQRSLMNPEERKKTSREQAASRRAVLTEEQRAAVRLRDRLRKAKKRALDRANLSEMSHEEQLEHKAKIPRTPRTSSEQPRPISIGRDEERAYCKAEDEHVIGIDEAGRGLLAGPVVAVACLISPDVHIDGIIDSRATKDSDREVTYELLTKTEGVMWGMSVISHDEVDELTTIPASLKAMSSAVKDLLSKYEGAIDITKCHILVDGSKIPSDLPPDARTTVAVLKGDSKIYSIAAASIIARVMRDRLMVEMDKKYPAYGFAQHKGCPTAAHRAVLLELGPSPIHRMTSAPVVKAAQMHGRIDEIKGIEEEDSSAIPLHKPKSSTKEKKERISKAAASAVAAAVAALDATYAASSSGFEVASASEDVADMQEKVISAKSIGKKKAAVLITPKEEEDNSEVISFAATSQSIKDVVDIMQERKIPKKRGRKPSQAAIEAALDASS